MVYGILGGLRAHDDGSGGTGEDRGGVHHAELKLVYICKVYPRLSTDYPHV